MGKTSWKTWFYKKQNQHSKKIIKHSFINNVTMQSHMIMKPAAFCVCLAINTRHAQAHTNVFSNYCLHCMSFEKIMNDTYKNLFFPTTLQLPFSPASKHVHMKHGEFDTFQVDKICKLCASSEEQICMSMIVNVMYFMSRMHKSL